MKENVQIMQLRGSEKKSQGREIERVEGHPTDQPTFPLPVLFRLRIS
jgi:hypothetical protein